MWWLKVKRLSLSRLPSPFVLQPRSFISFVRSQSMALAVQPPSQFSECPGSGQPTLQVNLGVCCFPGAVLAFRGFSTQTLFVPKSASCQVTHSGWKEPALPGWDLAIPAFIIHVLPVLRILIRRHLEPG